MIYIMINLIPILAATVAGLVLGAAYRAATGLRGSLALLPVAVLAEFWLAAILAGALILAPPKGGEWTMALGSASVIWAGFVAPVLAVTLLARNISWRATLADCLHWLVVMVVQAVVLKSIGLTPPPS